MLMVTRKPHRYNGGKRVEGTKRRQPYEFGDEFEVHRSQVGLVQTLGWGVPAEKKPAPVAKKVVAVKKAVAPAPVAAEPVQAMPPEAPAPQPESTAAPAPAPTEAPAILARGTYTRRDMTAEQRDD